MPPKLATVAGTRPEIIKLAHLIPHLSKAFDHCFIFTDQHFSPGMREVFFKDFHLNPDYSLNLQSSEYDVIAKAVHQVLEVERPSHVIVYGDTNSTVGATKAAKKIGAKVIHIESGLRSFDSSMPEERNRVFVDHNSDFLLAPTMLNQAFLAYEGYGNVGVTGNPVVDVCLESVPSALSRDTASKRGFDSSFLLLTLHRQENVDQPDRLKLIFKHLRSIIDNTIVFPTHPRTRARIASSSIDVPSNVLMIDPVDYLDFINLLLHCKVVLTDSGGVQEEAVTLRKPCVTLRENTERQESILVGANKLFPPLSSTDSLREVVMLMRSRTEALNRLRNPYGERGVTFRVLEAIERIVPPLEKQVLLARNS